VARRYDVDVGVTSRLLYGASDVRRAAFMAEAPDAAEAAGLTVLDVRRERAGVVRAPAAGARVAAAGGGASFVELVPRPGHL
jgi:hypothetical protein